MTKKNILQELKRRQKNRKILKQKHGNIENQKDEKEDFTWILLSMDVYFCHTSHFS